MNKPQVPSGNRSALLSDREREVLFLAAEGMTDKEIAIHLGIGPKTVRTYWDRMRAKLGAASRTQALAMALRAAYEELAEREARYRGFVEKLPALFLSMDETGHVDFMNEATRSAVGTQEESPRTEDVLSRLIPDAAIRAKIGASWAKGEETEGLILDLKMPTGTRRVAWYGHHEGSDPVSGHYLAVGVDITNTQPSPEMEALKVLIESADQAIWLLTPEFQTKYVNQAMAHLLGSTLDKLRKDTPLTYIGKEDLEGALQFIQSGGGTNVPFRFLRCDGTFIPVQKSLIPIRSNGQPVGYLILASERFAK